MPPPPAPPPPPTPPPAPNPSSRSAHSPSGSAANEPTRAIALDASPLTLAQVEAVCRHDARIEIAPEARRRLDSGRRALLAAMSDGEPHYGVNTGFGSFSRQRISEADLRDLQRNLVRSHAAGVGECLGRDVVRGMMLLLAASLSRGLSGVRSQVVEQIVALLNAGITPVVPGVGSCGASGDLAPLAHVALVLIGEGEADAKGRIIGGAEALRGAGIAPLTLEAKEGLALINGTHLMAAQGVLLVRDFERLFAAALSAAAMSIDACRATDAFLDPRVHEARCQPGQQRVAAAIRSMLEGSQIIPSHALNDPRVQDPYSLRCVPQVLGAAWDAFEHVRGAVERELGAVTDNPLVFAGASADHPAQIVSAGNFHGMPLAIALDLLAICICHVAGIAERRVYHMLSAFDPEAKLPPYLSPGPGLHSGLMIAQYTAAACCNELIGLSTPASVANLSTSAGMEDYNSFGPRAAAKARRALQLAGSVIAIELICGSEALDHHRPLHSGPAVERAHDLVRAVVPRLAADRPPAPDIAQVEGLITRGEFEFGF
ncbi:MAG: histidine ammonia-lyase [Phycisphaeraceae bacterium]|nr:histidine ammonia-lyase [Phycisphaeraceae bacterium]